MGNPSSRSWRTGLGLQERIVEAGLSDLRDLLSEDVLRILPGILDLKGLGLRVMGGGPP